MFGLTLYPSSGITCTGILSLGSDVGILYSSTPGTKYSSCASRKNFRVPAGSLFYQPDHLTSLVRMTLLVSGLYNLCVSLWWLSAYPTTISLYVFSVIHFLSLSHLVTYVIRPKYKNEPMIFGFSLIFFSKWTLCTTGSSHTLSYEITCMDILCPQHFMRRVI